MLPPPENFAGCSSNFEFSQQQQVGGSENVGFKSDSVDSFMPPFDIRERVEVSEGGKLGHKSKLISDKSLSIHDDDTLLENTSLLPSHKNSHISPLDIDESRDKRETFICKSFK